MTAAILCPGPSLARLKEAPQADLIIGVNRAATAFPCDTWAAGDTPMIMDHGGRVIGNPILLTSRETVSTIENAGKPWRGSVIEFQDMGELCPASLQWDLFSATIAIVYAAWRSCGSIRCYGMDWIGLADFDGMSGFGNRTPERWELERAVIERRLIPWLGQRGITFERA